MFTSIKAHFELEIGIKWEHFEKYGYTPITQNGVNQDGSTPT